MTLGTLDRTPPPFFRQGASGFSKLVFFSALAVFLMVADSRMKVADPLRSVLAVVLVPLQSVSTWPGAVWDNAGDYARGLRQAQAEEDKARRILALQAEKLARVQQLDGENQRLRALLELRPSLQTRSMAAEVMYEAADPFSRKVFIDRGQTHGVALGAPVINDVGVLGQVTHVYALTSEVTLLTDRNAAIPVINTRSQQRSAAFGGASVKGDMELRFMSGNADVRVGDELQTSGLDGIYPAGLPVARVVQVDRRAESGFARVSLALAAHPDGVRHVLLLEPLSVQLPPRPEPLPEPSPKGERQLKTPKRASAP